MADNRSPPGMPVIGQELLGYLNFSSGTPDVQFLRKLNELFAAIESSLPPRANVLDALREALLRRLDALAGTSPAFGDVTQSTAVLDLALREFPPRYRAFHRDLLFHESDAELWRPFFLGRVFEAVLAEQGPWDESERIITGAIGRLNDYIGHRPVAVLHSTQRMEPYRHEWIRPIPLYIRGAGVGVGRFHDIIVRAIDILSSTDAEILREAQFDPQLLDELALDPRAYEFDHPANKRPNYHFGQWDPHHIDGQGRYRRFVLQKVTLEALLDRVERPGELDKVEVLEEAAAVLAGTMLMASGTSGSGPDAYDSQTTLSTLLPRIAAYRDAFYDSFVAGLAGPHGERLRAEAKAGKQSLAGARQHLNQQLARRRAGQLEHVHLAILFARMGYPRAALQQASIVQAAAARMTCEIQCRLTTAHLAVDTGKLKQASDLLVEIEDFLHRAIECGALVDPWNILGFQGQFSLFPSPENSVPDHRIDQLIDLVGQILGLHSRAWGEAAARGETALEESIATRMVRLARWWDKFAATSVKSVEAFSGAEAYESARQVADALKGFRQAGAAAGDIAFWRKQVAHFNSAKTYALVVGALEQKPDLVAAMALLMQWLGQAGAIPLKQGDYSFHLLAERWVSDVCLAEGAGGVVPADRPKWISKFFDLLEANAEDYWQVPALELLGSAGSARDQIDDGDEDEEESHLYRAAYDDMVYIDSTGDGVDADMLEAGGPAATDFELEDEARRVGERLTFLRTVASMWKTAAVACGPTSSASLPPELLARWLEQAEENEGRLLDLLRSVDARRIAAPSASRDSMLEFDRRRTIKDALVEKVVATATETSDAARSMRAAMGEGNVLAPVDDLLRAVVAGNVAGVRKRWRGFLDAIASQPLLYVPLNRGGDPTRLTSARTLQQALCDLLQWLPRLGLLTETCQLLEAARWMESSNPVGPGAISEFDRLFSTGYAAVVDTLVAVSQDWPCTAGEGESSENDLVECLEQVTETLLKQWLAHSRTLRLSVLERIADEKSWKALVEFIERYGAELFTQRFLNLGNLRAILHQGVDAWLARLEDEGEPAEAGQLLEGIADGKLNRAEAVKHLTLIIEGVVENYTEYRDYNSTTTQSDRGNLLYTLLDFLRLRVDYDRVAWHLKPLVIAHATLVRHGRNSAAEAWRRALAERTSELADALQNRYAELRKKYAMRLPTVADRLAERFIRPLSIDRVRALIKPAMDDLRASQGGAGIELLIQEIDELTQEPTGVGLDVPAWLASLEQEVEDNRRAGLLSSRPSPATVPLPQAKLTREEVQRQLTDWELRPN